MSDLELAYLAGAMDADGFFCIHRSKKGHYSPTYYEFVGLAQLSPIVPRLLQARFGGYIQERKRKDNHAENWRPLYYWAGTARFGARAVDALRPYLRVKTGQADILIALRETHNRAGTRTIRVGIRGKQLNPDILAEREALYRKIRELNHNGVKPIEWPD